MRYSFLLILFLLTSLIRLSAQKERILLDGLFSDWENRPARFEDPLGDGRFGYDFRNLAMENDENFLYLSFDTGIEINIQENNDLVLFIDTDASFSTGFPFGGIGAEIVYLFGERGGYFYHGSQQINIRHDDIGLISLPTVSGDRFELALARNSVVNGQTLFPGTEIRCALLQDVQNGDIFPDDGQGLAYTFDNSPLEELPGYSLSKSASGDFRILSYNVLQDRLFENTAPFQRLITAIQPDIIAFQEIYDHSAAQTRMLIESFLGGSWYAAKQGNDIITVSRFPIRESHFISGNGAFLLELDGKDLLLINAHLPCCDNDSGRQEEVDAIMSFLRDAKNGQSSLDLQENTPVIIAGDMNFVGKNRQVQTLVEGNIQNEFLYGPDFSPDWDGSPLTDLRPFASHTPLALTWYDTYSSYNPGRLDYIIYSDSALKCLNRFSLFTPTLPQDSLTKYTLLTHDTPNAADHLPVVADFSLDTGSPVIKTTGNVPGELNIWPVPFSESIEISWKADKEQKGTLNICTPDGRVIYTRLLENSEEKLQVPTSDWTPGSYLVFLKMADHPIYEWIVKVE